MSTRPSSWSCFHLCKHGARSRLGRWCCPCRIRRQEPLRYVVFSVVWSYGSRARSFARLLAVALMRLWLLATRRRAIVLIALVVSVSFLSTPVFVGSVHTVFRVSSMYWFLRGCSIEVMGRTSSILESKRPPPMAKPIGKGGGADCQLCDPSEGRLACTPGLFCFSFHP